MTPTFTVTNLGDNPDDHGTGGAGAVDWLLDDLVDRVAEVRYVVMLSTDGLCVGASHALGRDESERFAAIASGFHSLAKGAGRHFDAGGVVQTMVELHGGFLFVVAAGDGSCIAVFTDGHADIGLVAYEMALLVERVREHLAVPARTDGAPTPDGGTS
ncbi:MULTISPECIES: roadblock/LC7 domain-containing protein [unclassified Streptomyces]|uniref:roadblock/LC7 domain-containing protein n=1 Tax=unclassified Streptomyces TaxID=2593676 RepID=UPI002DDB66F8|nr:roadblock/LC7 domain-containing protein [Streptomyces sp. NBC_01445]WSE03461.1 roadblock/LC7 domain-containing protein [Streptomyces sp. NBC_01445]